MPTDRPQLLNAVPEELRGRAMTLLTAAMMTIQGVGMVPAGPAAQFAPPSAVVAGAGALGTVGVLLTVRAVRRSESETTATSM